MVLNNTIIPTEHVTTLYRRGCTNDFTADACAAWQNSMNAISQLDADNAPFFPCSFRAEDDNGHYGATYVPCTAKKAVPACNIATEPELEIFKADETIRKRQLKMGIIMVVVGAVALPSSVGFFFSTILCF